MSIKKPLPPPSLPLSHPHPPIHHSGHQSFSNNRALNDFVGNIVHASIMVPYHGWRVSHRTHHSNHGHVENDESWHPVAKTLLDGMDGLARAGRLSLPWAMFAYPFYLWKRSPGKEGSHFDPGCDLFTEGETGMVRWWCGSVWVGEERNKKGRCQHTHTTHPPPPPPPLPTTTTHQVRTSNFFNLAMVAVLAAVTVQLGPLMTLALYGVPYWVNVVWLDLVTYLHHHGSSDANEKIPWYRGEEWSYLRGGLSTIDRDYGIFNKIHHDIGTHVVHHLFPQIPHYNLCAATGELVGCGWLGGGWERER